MRKWNLGVVQTLACVLTLSLTACGFDDIVPASSGPGVTVTSIAPQPFRGGVPEAFTLTGNNFSGAVVPDAVVRFEATAGTPFNGGTTSSVDVPGTVTSNTNITGTSPVAVTAGVVDATVTVILTSRLVPGATLKASSSSAIAQFVGPSVDSIAPPTVPSDIPAAFTITGDGFEPVAGMANVTFTATAGTPFAGGTSATASIMATIDSATQISGAATPIFGAIADAPCTVTATLPDTSAGVSAAAIFTVIAPTVMDVSPVFVDQAVPELVVISGTGFAPPGPCQVTFEAPAGTPFTGGTAGSLTVAGTIVNDTTITCTTPVGDNATRVPALVRVTNPSGATVISATSELDFEVAPDAMDDPAFATTGNVVLTVAAPGVLTNDTDPDMDALSVAAFDALSANGGTVSMAVDGSFTYEPPAGFTGPDFFTYTITDGRLFDTAIATMTMTSVVWFIDNSFGAGGTGTSASPFDEVADLNAIQGGLAGTEDLIFVYEASGFLYDSAGLTLLDDQTLLGEGVGLTVPGLTIPAGNQTQLGATTGVTLTLAANNAVRGLDISNTAGDGIAGNAFGTLTLDTASVDVTGGTAVSLASGTAAVTLADVDSTGATTEGITLDDVAGTFEVSGTATISTSTSHGLAISNSAGTFTFADVDIADSDIHGIDLNANTGAFTVNGGLIDNPDDIGISAQSCTGDITIAGVTIQETGDAAIADQDSHGILLFECTGSFTCDTCMFGDMNEHAAGTGTTNNAIQIVNTFDTVPSVQILDCAFFGERVGSLGTTTDWGIRIIAEGSTTFSDIDITGCTAQDHARGFCQVLCDVDDSGDAPTIADLNISGNRGIEVQGDAIEVRCNGGGTIANFDIDNNVLFGDGSGFSAGYGILVAAGQLGIGGVSTASVTGTISNNDIDNHGDGEFDRGIAVLTQDDASAVVTIALNEVDGQSGEAISIRCFDTSDANVTIRNNDLGLVTGNDDAGAGTDGVEMTTSQTAALCLDIVGNDVGSEFYVPTQDPGSTFNLDGIGAGPHGAATVDTFIEAANAGTSSASGTAFDDCTVTIP